MVGLVGWARAVRARQRKAAWGKAAADQAVAGKRPRDAPVLWLFTDAERVPDLPRAVAALPRGLAGVVFRHDGAPDRVSLARAVAAQCRACGVAMVVAGDARLAAAVGAGVHLRGGAWPGGRRGWLREDAWLTSSAHGGPGLRRASRAGADLVFLSPVWPTRSHPDALTLGVLRWCRLGRSIRACTRPAILALGGVGASQVLRLPRDCPGIGAIDGLAGSCG